MHTLFLKNIIRGYRLKKSTIPIEKKGTILLMFDGVSYSVLAEAIRRGYCPFIAQLMQKKSFELLSYYCGLPASTPAAEAHLFYGVNDAVPAFTWFDRHLNKLISSSSINNMKEVEKLLAGKHRALLKDGSCIAGIYDGGAHLGSYSISNLHPLRSIKSLFRLYSMFIPLINPFLVLYSWYIFLKNNVIALYDALINRSKSLFKSHLTQTATNLIFGEYVVFLAQIELLRNTPILFLNFTMFDWFAHWYGQRSKIAFSSLKLIDAYVKSIWKVSQQSDRSYDFIMFSDHGQSDSIYFNRLFGEPITNVVSRALKDTSYKVICTKHSNNGEKIEPNSVILTPSGSMIHLYFSNHFADPPIKKDIDKSFPQLLTTLINHKGIGWLLVRYKKNKQIFIGKNGYALFDNGAVEAIHANPLGSETTLTLDSMAQYAQNINNGDIVMFGNTINHKLVAFEDYKAAHGGFSGDMVWPFILTNKRSLLEELNTNANATQLYSFIRSQTLYSQAV